MSAPPEVRQATADAACVMEMLSQNNIEFECGLGGGGVRHRGGRYNVSCHCLLLKLLVFWSFDSLKQGFSRIMYCSSTL